MKTLLTALTMIVSTSVFAQQMTPEQAAFVKLQQACIEGNKHTEPLVDRLQQEAMREEVYARQEKLGAQLLKAKTCQEINDIYRKLYSPNPIPECEKTNSETAALITEIEEAGANGTLKEDKFYPFKLQALASDSCEEINQNLRRALGKDTNDMTKINNP